MYVDAVKHNLSFSLSYPTQDYTFVLLSQEKVQNVFQQRN